MDNKKNSSNLEKPEISNDIITLSNKDKKNPSQKAQNISEEKNNKIEKKISCECKSGEQAFLKNRKTN